jgi:hypothetical protein
LVFWIGDSKVCAEFYDTVVNNVSRKAAAQHCDTNKQHLAHYSSVDIDWDASSNREGNEVFAKVKAAVGIKCFCAVGK